MDLRLLDAAGSLSARRDTSFERRFEATFFNTGNILFFDALKKHLPSATAVYGWEDLLNSDGTAVISMANFINPYTDVSAEALTLRKSKVERIVLIGCGAQAANYGDNFPLRKDTLEFLSIVSERSASIGVRGYYTAELLNRNGFKNVKVIGCPSFFESGTIIPDVRHAGIPNKISIGVTPSGDARKQTKRLYEFGLNSQASYIVQAEQHLSGLFVDQPNEEQLKKLEFFSHYYCPDNISPQAFLSWLTLNASIFFELEEWHKHMRTQDFYIGTRIHGTVAAIQAGCPALTLALDSRTQELCQYFNLPFMPLVHFDPLVSPEIYYEMANYENFSATYHLRLSTYVDFLRENALDSPVSSEGPTERLDTGLNDRNFSRLNIGEATDLSYQMLSYSDARMAKGLSLSQLSISPKRELLLKICNPSGVCEQQKMPDEYSDGMTATELATNESNEGTIMTSVPEEKILRERVLERRQAFSESVSEYVRMTGQNPEFILGAHAKGTSVPPSKLIQCQVFSDRYKIIEKMPNEGNVAEVGTQTGRFANFILSTLDKVKLHTIDIDYSLFERADLTAFIEAKRLETIKGSSWEELAKFPEEFFSWIYIDASHFYDHVKSDLENAKKRVKIGGYIVCNDYTNWSPFEADNYGVLQAVNEFLAEEDFDVSYLAFHPFGYNDIALRRRS